MQLERITSLHIIGGKGLGGAEMFCARLVNALHADDQAVSAVTAPASPLCAHLAPAIRRYHVPMLGVWDVYSRWQIRSLVARTRPHVVQTYMGRATRLTHLPFASGAVHVARLGGYYDLKGYRHAHAWVANTRGLCDHLIRGGLPADRVHHIGNFVDIPASTPAERLRTLSEEFMIPDDAWVIVALGRLHPAKGFDDLLRALALLPGAVHGRTPMLLVIGDGPVGGRLRRLAHDLGISGRIRWTGWRTDIAMFLHRADLFVCPSRQETLGNVILEAWAHGSPVLSTRTAGPAEFASHGDNCWLVPVGDARAMAAAIELLLRDDPLRQRLAREGQAEVRARHSAEVVVSAYRTLYSHLVGNGGSEAREPT